MQTALSGVGVRKPHLTRDLRKGIMDTPSILGSMKRFLSLLLLFAFVVMARADLVSYEPFDYALSNAITGTNLVGNTNVDGRYWSLAGVSTSGFSNQPSFFPGSFSYPGLPDPRGNSVKFGGNNNMAARYSLLNPVTTGSLYYSFILRVTDITGLSASGVFFLGFNNSQGPQGTLPNIVVTRLVAKSSGGGFQLGLDKSSGGAGFFQFDPTVFPLDTNIFVVGSYTFVTGVTNDDESRMWINPDASSFGAALPPLTNVLVSTNGGDIGSGQIASFCLFNRNAAEPAGMVLDELRIGTSWQDVTSAVAVAPTLQIALSGGNIVLSWPTNASGFTLQTNSALTLPGSWGDVSSGTVVGPNYEVIDALGTGPRFYRLRK